MGFLMRKTQPLLGSVNFQPAVFARVCLLMRGSGCEARLHRGNHAKPDTVELNLLPLVDLSLTQRHTRHRCATLQSA